MSRYLIIDGNNIVHAASGTKPLKVGNTQVQGIYHFMRMLRQLMATYHNATPIVLWDGASWRHMAFPDYKGNRTKNETKSDKIQQEQRAIAKGQMPAIKKGLQLLGVAQIRATNMEADDLAQIVGDRKADEGHKVILVSGDKDWVQLVGPRANGGSIMWLDVIGDRKIRSAADVEEALKYKVADFKQFLELKCIMGDLGDNLSGVGGIGDKGAMEFLATYGSVSNFSAGVMDKSIDLAKLPKKIRDFAESEEKQIIFQRNMKLMDLRTKQRPAPINMQIDKGSPDAERFRTFCTKLLFNRILAQYENWLSVFPAFQNLQEDLAA